VRKAGLPDGPQALERRMRDEVERQAIEVYDAVDGVEDRFVFPSGPCHDPATTLAV
jgi:hypothetical protein